MYSRHDHARFRRAAPVSSASHRRSATSGLVRRGRMSPALTSQPMMRAAGRVARSRLPRDTDPMDIPYSNRDRRPPLAAYRGKGNDAPTDYTAGGPTQRDHSCLRISSASAPLRGAAGHRCVDELFGSRPATSPRPGDAHATSRLRAAISERPRIS